MYENWKNYFKVYDGKKLEAELTGQLIIFDEAVHFHLSNFFCTEHEYIGAEERIDMHQLPHCFLDYPFCST